ncbi:MAG: YbjP/YqhG family protein [Pseudomonadota bacterium]|nr:YbjP/YqhG family protein [Pseudomonadota bacterium]
MLDVMAGRAKRSSLQLYGDGQPLALDQSDRPMLMQSWPLEMHIIVEESSMAIPFSPKAWRALALGALILLAQCAAQAKGQAPEEAAVQFYRWYMQSLAINQDPLRQSPVQMSAYVEKGLVNDLKKRMSRKGLHADYFIQAQEFMDDWTTDIRAVRPTVQGNMASVVIILGASPETKRILALMLKRDEGDWKICMVRLV